MHHSYIIRIYRHDKNNPRIFVGTVEKVGEQDKSAFTNYDELWDQLNSMGKDKITRSQPSDRTGRKA
jgi:hypothetical protein